MSLRLSKHGQTSDIFGTQANSTSEAGKTRMGDTRNQLKVGDECLWGFGNSKFNSFEASLCIVDGSWMVLDVLGPLLLPNEQVLPKMGRPIAKIEVHHSHPHEGKS
ncbi:hypothetical protein B0H11DRAFT_1919066 [Mycena galericulata]|nr:hypothetical protein B0H11DRAFT_1919066 [Mycena galericulata]